MGRAHRHFFRICAMDKRTPRDGKVLEELGTYDPMVADADARAKLKSDRIDYWLSVGAQPSEKCAVLIKKYGTEGTHLEQQRAALERLAMPHEIPDAGEPVKAPKSEEAEAVESKSEENSAEAAPAAEGDAAEAKPEASAEAPAEEKAEEAPAEEAKAEEAPAEEEKSE